jgi:hypothetical protein
MSYNIPHRYEPEIEQIAIAQNISQAKALDRIMQAGIERFQARAADKPSVSYVSLFAAAKGPGTYKTREEVDRYIAELRNEW